MAGHVDQHDDSRGARGGDRRARGRCDRRCRKHLPATPREQPAATAEVGAAGRLRGEQRGAELDRVQHDPRGLGVRAALRARRHGRKTLHASGDCLHRLHSRVAGGVVDRDSRAVVLAAARCEVHGPRHRRAAAADPQVAGGLGDPAERALSGSDPDRGGGCGGREHRRGDPARPRLSAAVQRGLRAGQRAPATGYVAGDVKRHRRDGRRANQEREGRAQLRPPHGPCGARRACRGGKCLGDHHQFRPAFGPRPRGGAGGAPRGTDAGARRRRVGRAAAGSPHQPHALRREGSGGHQTLWRRPRRAPPHRRADEGCHRRRARRQGSHGRAADRDPPAPDQAQAGQAHAVRPNRRRDQRVCRDGDERENRLGNRAGGAKVRSRRAARRCLSGQRGCPSPALHQPQGGGARAARDRGRRRSGKRPQHDQPGERPPADHHPVQYGRPRPEWRRARHPGAAGPHPGGVTHGLFPGIRRPVREPAAGDADDRHFESDIAGGHVPRPLHALQVDQPRSAGARGAADGGDRLGGGACAHPPVADRRQHGGIHLPLRDRIPQWHPAHCALSAPRAARGGAVHA